MTLALLYFLKKSKGWCCHLPKQKLMKAALTLRMSPLFSEAAEKLLKLSFSVQGAPVF